jgi:hypothetical protein
MDGFSALSKRQMRQLHSLRRLLPVLFALTAVLMT